MTHPMPARVLALAVSLAGTALTALPARAQVGAFTPDVAIDQDAIAGTRYPDASAKVPLSRVIKSGQQYFNVPFTPATPDPKDPSKRIGDGLGEGPTGPRAFERRAFWPYPWPNAGTTLAGDDNAEGDIYEFPFVKLNGLGATSCFDCHSSIGDYTDPNTPGPGRVRKPSTPGGSGGFSTNAFINDEYPARNVKLIRNPPHVFGTGYTQRLAEEMSIALKAQAEAVCLAAWQTHRPSSLAMTAKGVAFGTIAATPPSSGRTVFDQLALTIEAFKTPTACVLDTSAVAGVEPDLIVRPFQWKGISSSVRHFARDALDFHFSVQATEKVGGLDCDGDGLTNEASLGNVAALAAYVAMMRPPAQEVPPGQEQLVARGAAVFSGQGINGLPAAAKGMCASCHVPSMTIDQAILTIQTPKVPDGKSLDDCPGEAPSLTDPVPASELPANRAFALLFPQVIAAPSVRAAVKTGDPTQIYAAMVPVLAHVDLGDLLRGNVQIDLSLAPDSTLPATMFPRLPVGAGGAVAVPLFSDLRQHSMGGALQDPGSQGADVAGVSVAPPLFVTRPLWGVADSGPWMHDGRGRSLREAILLHGSPGSDAAAVVTAFRALPAADQAALEAFLLTLRLPVAAGY